MDLKQTSGSLTCRIALAGAASTVLLIARVSSAAADETVQPIPALPPISIGVGLQTSIYACDNGHPHLQPRYCFGGRQQRSGHRRGQHPSVHKPQERNQYAQIDFQH